jgi:hypothetical protein
LIANICRYIRTVWRIAVSAAAMLAVSSCGSGDTRVSIDDPEDLVRSASVSFDPNVDILEPAVTRGEKGTVYFPVSSGARCEGDTWQLEATILEPLIVLRVSYVDGGDCDDMLERMLMEVVLNEEYADNPVEIHDEGEIDSVGVLRG